MQDWKIIIAVVPQRPEHESIDPYFRNWFENDINIVADKTFGTLIDFHSLAIEITSSDFVDNELGKPRRKTSKDDFWLSVSVKKSGRICPTKRTVITRDTDDTDPIFANVAKSLLE